MPFTSAGVKKKQSKSVKNTLEKRKYATKCINKLIKQEHVGLFLDPGLGKTKIFLDAFTKLRDKGEVRRVLVVAKVRICHNVWPEEIKKWNLDITCDIINRKNIKDVLYSNIEIVLVSYEYLRKVLDYINKLYLTQYRFDWLCFDESTKMKGHNSKRFKAVRHKLRLFNRRTILTGTPTPHSYLDLWSQIFCLDLGEALYKNVGRYRLQYFEPCGYEGREWCIVEGSEPKIIRAVKHLVLRFDRSELDIPPLHNISRKFKLSDEVTEKYRKLERDFVLEIEDKGISDAVLATSSGSASMKLRQLVGGAVYNEDRKSIWMHNEKIEELRDLIEELQGEPLLVAYEFQHEITRLLKEFPKAEHIGKGVSYKKGKLIEDRWNAGEIPLLFGNPASVGHGLNMQGHGCHIAIFTGTWNWENYTQFIQRIWRSGQRRPVTVHHIIAEDTVDEVVFNSSEVKGFNQQTFFDNLKLMLSIGESDGEKKEAKRAKTVRKSNTETKGIRSGRKVRVAKHK